MNTKRSMVVLFVTAAILFALPTLAFAAENLPEKVDAQEQMSFEPLLYVTILLMAITLSSVVVSLVFAAKYRSQKDLLCHTYTCHNNPLARLENEGAFDYRQFETPNELFTSNHAQSDYAVAEAIKHLIDKVPGLSGQKTQSPVAVLPPLPQSPSSHIVVPQTSVVEQVPQTPMAEQVPQTPMAEQVVVKPRPTYQGKHMRKAASVDAAAGAITATLPRITLVPSIQQQQAGQPLHNSDEALSLSEKLEYVRRKIS